jgi:hypothetical protein
VVHHSKTASYKWVRLICQLIRYGATLVVTPRTSANQYVVNAQRQWAANAYECLSTLGVLRTIYNGRPTLPSYSRRKTSESAVWKLLLAIAAVFDLEVEQMDAVTAFLNGITKDTIYVELPDGYKDGDLVCLLLRALYGLNLPNLDSTR